MSSKIITASNPAFAAKLDKLRDRSLKPQHVRSLCAEMTQLIAEDAISASNADEKIAIIAILRSGLVMVEPFLSKLPSQANTVVYHLGLFRERQTLQPVEYYNKLGPKTPTIRHGYILDPLLATGGTAEAAINILK
jgi:uracil phosphoribosyltransferase